MHDFEKRIGGAARLTGLGAARTGRTGTVVPAKVIAGQEAHVATLVDGQVPTYSWRRRLGRAET
jgi:hypothetical protein